MPSSTSPLVACAAADAAKAVAAKLMGERIFARSESRQVDSTIRHHQQVHGNRIYSSANPQRAALPRTSSVFLEAGLADLHS